MEPRKNGFIKLISNPFKFRLFLLAKLPAAFFTGLRIVEITTEKCTTLVPYKWFNRNPFRSTYFASLAMAAELSTGALAMAKVYKRKPRVSMLVIKLEAEYFKKATGATYFTCTNGVDFESVISKTIATNTPQVLQAISVGTNEAGELVARFCITWSFKAKS